MISEIQEKTKETEFGPIPEDWDLLPIYDLAIWINGLAFKNINFSSNGKPVIKINELKYGVTEQTRFTNDVFSNDYFLSKGDLLFSWSGSPDTSIDAFWYNLPDGWLNQHIFKVKPKDKVTVDFLYYLFKVNKQRFIEIARDKQTTGLGHVTIADLKRFNVVLPEIYEQKKIAEILSSLDDKIELNRQENSNLEKLANVLFKHWFVDFEFPDKDGKPYKSSGGKMVDSELGEIPEGWRVRKISDVVSSKGGSTPDTKEESFWRDGKINWATPRDLANLNSLVLLDTDKRITDKGLKKISSGLLPVKTILLSSRAPIGYVAVAEIPVAVNQGFIAITCEPDLHGFILFWIKNNIELIESRANGSTFLEINKASFRDIDIVIPATDALRKFSEITESIIEAISSNEKESKKLTGIRDSLLSRLMSGKIRVNKL